MMKKLITILAVFSFIFLTACGNTNDDSSNSENVAEASLQPLKVEFISESDAFQPGQEGIIQVKVTKGEENVSDADEVQFEIWKKGHQDESKKVDVANKGDGVYALKHTFKEKGMYKVISHVTARSTHTMPTKVFKVGNVEVNSAQDEHEQSDLMVMLMTPDTIKANKEVMLTAHLQKDNKPLHDANVRLEYWQEGQEKHTYMDANEKEKGKYQADVTFPSLGNYNVKVHVKKGELHTHKEEKVKVQ